MWGTKQTKSLKSCCCSGSTHLSEWVQWHCNTKEIGVNFLLRIYLRNKCSMHLKIAFHHTADFFLLAFWSLTCFTHVTCLSANLCVLMLDLSLGAMGRGVSVWITSRQRHESLVAVAPFLSIWQLNEAAHSFMKLSGSLHTSKRMITHSNIHLIILSDTHTQGGRKVNES